MPSMPSAVLNRYARQYVLPQVGAAGQQRLAAARVLCVGAGGLGSPFLLYLAAAGVGTLGVVDGDRVEVTNLQRQVLYTAQDVGKNKAVAAKARLSALNPSIEVIAHAERLTEANALAIVGQYDVVADGTDNFAARYLVNDACFYLRKPNIYASVFQFEGRCSVFMAGQGPCYRCLYATPPPAGAMPNCAEGGVLGVLPGLLGTLQATEALKLILGIGSPLVGRLLTVDALTLRFQEYSVAQDPDCRLCCHRQPFETLPRGEGAEGCEAAACRGLPADAAVTAAEFQRLRRAGADFILLDVREPAEYAERNLGGRLIPLEELPRHLGELDRSKRVIVHCQTDPRSRRAVQCLRAAGFSSAQYLAGGLLGVSND